MTKFAVFPIIDLYRQSGVINDSIENYQLTESDIVEWLSLYGWLHESELAAHWYAFCSHQGIKDSFRIDEQNRIIANHWIFH